MSLEYGYLEKHLLVSLTEHSDSAHTPAPAPEPTTALTPSSATRLLRLLRSLPHGVHKMSHALPGLVETSNNVASVRRGDGGNGVEGGDGVAFEIVTCTRSSMTHALEELR